jgi:hypothetical protein
VEEIGVFLITIVVPIGLSIWFWKNPIDTSFQKELVIFNKESDHPRVAYEVGHDHKGWKIIKTIVPSSDDELSGKKLRSYASRKNNPKIRKSPSDIDEIQGLIFE